jgi:hypothetical protein
MAKGYGVDCAIDKVRLVGEMIEKRQNRSIKSIHLLLCAHP